MITYIAVIALAFVGFALHEFAMNHDLRVAAPGKDKLLKRRPFARLNARFEPVAAGTRLPTRTPPKGSPLALTHHLGTHA